MEAQTILELLDELTFAKIGKHLDDLQSTILKGTLQGQTYANIAKEVHLSEGHIRDEASQLWKLLSEVLGENISRANIKTTIERSFLNNISSSSPFSKNILRIDNINICPESSQNTINLEQPSQLHTQPYIDLENAPETIIFHGRTEELNLLENWIINDKKRLIAVLGFRRIGKTPLTLKLIQQVKSHFDYIIYRSLSFTPTLSQTLKNLLRIFAPETDIPQTLENQLSQLINYLSTYRCLIIFDDLENLYDKQKLAGEYKSGYEDY